MADGYSSADQCNAGSQEELLAAHNEQRDAKLWCQGHMGDETHGRFRSWD